MSEFTELQAHVAANCKQAEKHPKVGRRVTSLTVIELDKDPNAEPEEIRRRVKQAYKGRFMKQAMQAEPGVEPKQFIISTIILQIIIGVIVKLIADWIVDWWQRKHPKPVDPDDPNADRAIKALYRTMRAEAEAELEVD